MKIGLFDSGVGGLTVFNEVQHRFPNEAYVYFADSKNAPYGSKSECEVEALVLEAVDFLARQDIDLLLLACYTASHLMIEKVRRLYDFPILAMRPHFPPPHALDPKKTVVCATNLSVNFWEAQLANRGLNVDFLSLQQLIVFAERFEFESTAVINYLCSRFEAYDWNLYRSIFLGCTHFSFFKPHLRQILPDHVHILDGTQSTIRQLDAHVPFSTGGEFNSTEYFVSGKRQDATLFQNYLGLLSKEVCFELV